MSDLSNNLLKQNGTSSNESAAAERQRLIDQIAALRRRGQQARTRAKVLWALVVIAYFILPGLLMRNVSPADQDWMNPAIVRGVGLLVLALLIPAVIYTIAAYNHGRSAGTMQINAHLARLESQIEQLLQQRERK